MVNDRIQWSGPVPKEDLGKATIDGILGPTFPGYVQNILKIVRATETDSEKMLYEWSLISMPGDEARRDLGLNNTHIINAHMLKWGYRRPKTWEPDDFNMFFDRLFLRMRIEDVATKYNYTESAVQRRTARLAKLLRLNLPKAPHKKHRRN